MTVYNIIRKTSRGSSAAYDNFSLLAAVAVINRKKRNAIRNGFNVIQQGQGIDMKLAIMDKRKTCFYEIQPKKEGK